SRYELTLEPDLEASSFTGWEDVSVTVHERVGEVVLNASELEIDAAWVIPSGGGRLDATVQLDREGERASLRLARPIEPGDAVLHLEFRGTLNDKLHGFYRSVFTDEVGTTHTIATTQMQS